MQAFYLALLMGMNLLWACSYAIFKVLGEQMDSGAIATIRFALAALCLLVVWPWLPGRGPRRGEWLRVSAMGLIVFCIAPRLQIEAVHLGKAGDTSLLMALDPLLTAFAAALFLKEKVPARRWWGCGLGMLGVVLLSKVWQGDTPLRGLLPNTLFVISLFCETFYSVFSKGLLDKVGLLKLLASGLFAGTGANLALELFKTGPNALQIMQHLPLTTWAWLVYLALICTLVGYSLWYVVIRRTEVNVAGLTVLMQPMAGWLLSIVWLREDVHSGQLWGAIAILAGLVIGLKRQASPVNPVLGVANPVAEDCEVPITK